MELWRLEILLEGGRVVAIYGAEDTMARAADEIKTGMASTDGIGEKVVSIHGMCDTADRADKTVVLLVSVIHGFDLTKLY